MFEIVRVGVTLGARFSQPFASGEIVVEAGASPVLRVFNPVADETVRVGLSAAGASVLSFAAQGAARVAVTVGGVAGSLPRDLVAAALLPGAGSLTASLMPGVPLAGQAVEVLGLELGGVAHLAAARGQGSGVELFRVGADQALVRVAAVADAAGLPLAGVGALASATVGGGRVLLFAGSAAESGVTVMEVGAGGTVEVLGSLGVAQGVPVAGIRAMEAVAAFGETWLVVAASGTSSVTVFRVGADGGLVPVEHVFDELATRFQSVVAMDVLAVGERVLVAVAGADEGVSLFGMIPGGRLVHLATLADRADLGLANVSALRMAVVEGAVQIVALSGAEAGLTVLSVPLATLGVVGGVTGGAGRDVLVDGAGGDTLTGGAGADVFVLTADGVRDVIADVDPALDRIDLTGWSFFRNAGQLAVTLTATGAVMRFGAEELELRTAAGRALTLAEVQRLVAPSQGRLGLEVAAQVVAPVAGPTEGADSLTGTAGADTVAGGGGADSLWGGDGEDSLSGDAGDDVLEGGVGNDRLFGGIGADRLLGGDGADRLEGGDGGDTLDGGEGADTLVGGEGVDSLIGGGGADVLAGDGGDDVLAGEAGDDALDGGAGNDRLFGGIGADRLVGGDGVDWLEGLEEADQLCGGDGDDLLLGGAGEDLLEGGAGGDRLQGDAGNDRLYGGAGVDRLEGGGGADSLWGGEGDDSLIGGEGDDVLEGGDGADVLMDLSGRNVLWGGDGDDRLGSGAGADTLAGDGGNDLLEAGAGEDLLWGGDGNDTLLGGIGRDSLDGGGGNDLLYGDGGNDLIWGGAGADQIWGGDGADRIGGGAGADTIRGGAGNDRLDGGAGRDLVLGDEGDDLLFGWQDADSLDGGAGNDRLSGDAGNDTLTGGAGADVFVFANLARGEVDRITDFQQGIDRIELPAALGGFGALKLRAAGGAVEVVAGGHTILLPGQGLKAMDASDFLFL